MRKFLLLILLVSLIAIGFYLFSSKPSAKVTKKTTESKIRLVSLPVKSYYFIPVAVASEKGLFKKHNIEVDYQVVEKNISSVIVAGKADVAIASPYAFLAPVVQGAKLSWVGTIANDSPLGLISYKKPGEIKTVGVKNQVTRVIVERLLKKLNVNLKNIEFQEMGSIQAELIALRAKKIDAIGVLRTDWMVFAKKNNLSEDEFSILIDTTKNEETRLPGGIIARNEYLKTNKETVENFSKAILEATNWAETNKKETSEIIGKKSGIGIEEADIYLEDYLLAVKKLKFAPSKEKGEELLGYFAQDVPKAKDFDIEGFIYLLIAKDLEKSGFLKKLGY